MKVFAMKHSGVYLGGYSVVVSEDEESALELMREGLKEAHLLDDGDIECVEIDVNKKFVTMLCNGDY